LNRKAGMYASIVTLVAVVGFALSMILQNSFGSYLFSMFIAWGFIPMICAFASFSESETKSVSYTAMAFAGVYAVLIMLVYFAQLTTVRLTELSGQASELLNYQKLGLFFNYDLLGYGFMALATFFIALSIGVKSKADQALKILLMVHGVFAITCVVIPMLGIFQPGLAGGDMIGVLVLEFWCAFFTPICILSYLHFKKQQTEVYTVPER
jgi:hypothetical protein